MVYPDTAEGFMISDQKQWKNFEKKEFKLKPFEDRDIDIAIECCGVCGSDVHTMYFLNTSASEWIGSADSVTAQVDGEKPRCPFVLDTVRGLHHCCTCIFDQH